MNKNTKTTKENATKSAKTTVKSPAKSTDKEPVKTSKTVKSAGKIKDEEEVDVDAAVSEGAESYDEKVEDYKAHFENLGMSDPGTEARIAAMETATPRSDGTELDRSPDLIDRDNARIEHHKDIIGISDPGSVIIGEEGRTRRDVNQEQSEVVSERQEHDIAVQEGKEEKPSTGTNRSEKVTSR